MSGYEWPDWQDAGQLVEVMLEDGCTTVGELFVGGFFAIDEDDVPVLQVRLDDGEEAPFPANRPWPIMANE